MAEHPNESRMTVDLPVRVWGMSADGRAFSQHARAQNISSEGALLNGVESELKVGDVIGLQCDDKKARCTVIWAVNTGAIKKNQIGVKLVADQECPWRKYLPVDGDVASEVEMRIAGAITGTRSVFQLRCAMSACKLRSASTPPM